jgi:hypothetical protein
VHATHPPAAARRHNAVEDGVGGNGFIRARLLPILEEVPPFDSIQASVFNRSSAKGRVSHPHRAIGRHRKEGDGLA